MSMEHRGQNSHSEFTDAPQIGFGQMIVPTRRHDTPTARDGTRAGTLYITALDEARSRC